MLAYGTFSQKQLKGIVFLCDFEENINASLNICAINKKMEPADGWYSLALRLETGVKSKGQSFKLQVVVLWSAKSRDIFPQACCFPLFPQSLC